MAKGFYKAPLNACEPVSLFLYDSTHGPVDYIGDLAGYRYFYISNDDIPIPTSAVAEFIPVVLNDELRLTLHAMAPASMKEILIPSPNTNQLAEDVWADPILEPVRVDVVSFKTMLDSYLAMGELGQQRIYEAWTVNIQPKFDAVNPILSALIVAHAVANHVKLVPPEQETAALQLVASFTQSQNQ